MSSDKNLLLIIVTLIAYLLKRLGVFKPQHSEALVNYVIYVAFPSLVFLRVREIPISRETANFLISGWIYLLICLGISFAVAKLLRLPEKTLRSFILMSSFGNTAFLGFPVTYSLLGKEALPFAILYDQGVSFLSIMTLGFLIAGGSVSLKNILTFPPFLALVLSLILRDFSIPENVEFLLETLASSLFPVVLVSLGISFSLRDAKERVKLSTLAILLKTAIFPFIIATVLKVSGMTSLEWKVFLIESAMPPMVMASILVIKYRLDSALAVTSVNLGMVLGFLLPGLWLKFLEI